VTFEQPVYVEATSPKDLQEKLSLYKQCGQVAKPIREIDPATDAPISAPAVLRTAAPI